jgi:hypothetical protein
VALKRTMKIHGYTDPCGVWWAIPKVSPGKTSFVKLCKKRLAYKKRILKKHSVKCGFNGSVTHINRKSDNAIENINNQVVEAPKPKTMNSRQIDQHGNKKLKSDERFVKYFKMLTVGLSKEAVQHRMQRDGVDPKILDMDPEKPYSDGSNDTNGNVNKGPPLKSDERFVKYFKMLTVGLSKEAVQHRMQRDGVDPKILDMDPEKPYSDGSNDTKGKNTSTNKTSKIKLKKKKNGKKHSDGLIRKKLHWKKISGKRMVGSIWERLMEGYRFLSKSKDEVFDTNTKNSEVLKPFELDNREQKEMKALFCISVEKNKKKNNATKKPSKVNSSGSKKKQLVQLLEMTRANNISIVLARFDSISFDEILYAMSSFDPKNISAENYRSLLSLAPTAAELETLKAYDGPKDAKTLGKAERFCLSIGNVPRYTSRIRCFLYSLKFDEAIQDIELDLDLLHETSKRVTNATSLHNALNVVLALGNFLNKGGSNGDADGVSIDSLNRLKNVKSYGTKTTALHYFAIVAQSRAPDILKLSEQCGDCRGASSVVLSQIVTDLKLLQRGFDMLLKECEKVKSDVKKTDITEDNFKNEVHDLNLLFLKSSDHVCQQYKSRLDEISKKMDDTQLAYTNMLKFYGELETKKASDFFSGVADFIVEFENARKDNEESRQRAKKRAAAKQRVENMREKSKARARRRSRDLSAEQKNRRNRRTPSPSITQPNTEKLVLPSTAPPMVSSNKKSRSSMSSDENTDDGEDSFASPFAL